MHPGLHDGIKRSNRSPELFLKSTLHLYLALKTGHAKRIFVKYFKTQALSKGHPLPCHLNAQLIGPVLGHLYSTAEIVQAVGNSLLPQILHQGGSLNRIEVAVKSYILGLRQILEHKQ